MMSKKKEQNTESSLDEFIAEEQLPPRKKFPSEY